VERRWTEFRKPKILLNLAYGMDLRDNGVSQRGVPMPPESPPPEKLIIGRSEYLDLPDWHIRGLLAKVDTGARSSALHVENLVELAENRVMFNVVLSNGAKRKYKRIIAEVVRWAKVKSSSGHYNMRCFVRTRIRIGGVIKEIEISLDSRDDMSYRMLLGRSALEGEFLVDVGKRHAFGIQRMPKKTTGKTK